VIITTGRIRRTLVNKINLLVDSPRSIEASRLASVKAEPIFLHRASKCLGTSRGSSCGSSLTTSTTPCVRVPHTRGSSRDSSRRSSSTSSPTTHVRVPRHVARLVTRLVVDYFTYAARPRASARRADRHAARCRLLRLRRASRCLSSLCDSSLTTSPRAGSSSTTSPTPRVRVPRHVARLVTRLVVDYFGYATRPGASARRAARHVARRRLLHLRRASDCFGTSRESSSTTSPRAGSSLTTSPTPRVRVPRHVARLVTQLVVDYFT
jgi:hypothetical protein